MWVDVIIGAPLEDDMRGAIYIFSGSYRGLLTTYTQRIAARSIASKFYGFGQAIQSGFDRDENKMIGTLDLIHEISD